VLTRQEARQDVCGADPGVLVLDQSGAVLSLSPEAELWLDELVPGGWSLPAPLPLWLRALVASRVQERAPGGATSPAARVRTQHGQWLSVTASPLVGRDPVQVAVVLAPATPLQLMPLLLDAHGLTPAQQRVVECVLRGRSSREVGAELHISLHTVQEHLQAAYSKVGVGSRRELITTLMTT
jgi:DNA-binding CsgD family transcriptional regulator